jgi:hydroxyacylglutathione hydrolase
MISALAHSQAPQADGGGVKPGVLPRSWEPSGPHCPRKPKFQIDRYNDDFYILRESGCSNTEKPFLFLLFGRQKAFLLDTGAGQTEIAGVVQGLIGDWLKHRSRESIDLVVAHTHAHLDHIAGDAQLKMLPHTIVIEPNRTAVQGFFGIRNWPADIVTFDLGDRVLDVIPIPGHEPSSIAIYDRQTGVLFTGDTLYPGRLYVRNEAAFFASIQRLVDFTQGKIVAHILGNHIEQRRTPFLDYAADTLYQPDEHALELGRAHLIELNEALKTMYGRVARMAMRDFTVYPDLRPNEAQ